MSGAAEIRVGVVCDLLEENWPSMDLVAEELLRSLPAVTAPRVAATGLRPTMPRWPATAAGMLRLRAAVNANRYLDRHRRYPRWLRRHQGGQDVYHVVDHTYAHLVHELPARRTIVTCHDVDAFRSLFDPAAEPRSGTFRRMTQRVLDGLRRAELVVCDSVATRDALIAHGLRTLRLEVVPLGVDPAFHPAPHDDAAIATTGPTVLHVGSTIPRKRIDLVLTVFARLRAVESGARLVRVGGAFTPEQTALVRALHVQDAVTTMPYVARDALADLYRTADLVLLTSDAEGFGLPVLEAMASGTAVVARDLPVLREVGGDAVTYIPSADADVWAAEVTGLLRERATAPERWEERRRRAVERAGRFSWTSYAQQMARLYGEVARG